MSSQEGDRLSENANWPKRLIVNASIAAILFLCFWYVFDIILLAFAGALVAIILHACVDWVQRHTPKYIGPRLSYAATVLGFVILICLIGYWIVPRAISEAGQIVQIIPQSVAQLTAHLDKTDWGRHVEHGAHQLMSGSNAGSRISTLTRDAATALEYTIVIVVVGLYGAFNAREYSNGLLRWIPEGQRQNFLKISRGVAYTLRWWLIGQLVPMVVLGIASMIGLWPGGSLGFHSGAAHRCHDLHTLRRQLDCLYPDGARFLDQGRQTAIYVTILYLVIHLLEGYVLTPIVQKRAVLVPPTLTILALLFMWKVSGLLGASLATPIVAASLALGKMLYLHKDVGH